MIGFPSGPKFIKLKKQCRELKILTSTYEASYQLMCLDPNTLENDQPLSFDSDDTTFVIAT